jgi:pyrroloquinoline quinone (PQQ) biosynthesis protein C
MTFYQELAGATRAGQSFLQSAPVIQRCLDGDVTRELYVAFLTQAYHHVRHTVPLLMAVGPRLPERHAALGADILHYLEEEQGHDAWILDDIAAAGADRVFAAASKPNVATDALIAYAWDTVQRRNPLGFFGMVFVLEGTSVSLALRVADRIQVTLGLPDGAFTYLRSHGRLDQQHVQHLAGILERLGADEDREAVRDCARAMFWLYGHLFRSLETSSPSLARPSELRQTA